MEEDLKEIEKLVLKFCRKYNCSIELDTITNGRNLKGEVIPVKIASKILR